MKRIALAALLSVSLALPSMAMSAKTAYRIYRPVYWTIEVVTFLIAGPAIIITSLNQHVNDQLKGEAETEEDLEQLN